LPTAGHGRAALLDDLVELLRAGRGGLAVVTGEPGIGKTWLAAETARAARAHNVRVGWSACWEGDGAPAHWPWIQLLRDLGAAALADELRDGVPWLAAEPAAQRLRLVENIDRVLRDAGPVLLVIDDLQWADVGSVRLLEILGPMLTGRPVTVLGTVRDEPSGAVAGLRAAVRVRLSGMTPAELGALVGLKGDQLAVVHERTGGNPLFATELVRLRTRRRSASPMCGCRAPSQRCSAGDSPR
jgi:hypothetical protein